MKTEWHDYKSTKTRQTAGSYFYLPEKTDDVLAHAYFIPGRGWVLHGFVDWIVPLYPFATLQEAKLYAACQAAAHHDVSVASLGVTHGSLLQPKLF